MSESVSEMVEAVLCAEKPLTESEIAERIGVSRPTVAKYREHLQSYADIEHGDVGGSRAYWTDKTGKDGKVKLGDMIQAIKTADKPLTASDIAEATGVTQQAISKRKNEIEQHPRIEYDQIGNARAYWIDSETRDTGAIEDQLQGMEQNGEAVYVQIQAGAESVSGWFVQKQRDETGSTNSLIEKVGSLVR